MNFALSSVVERHCKYMVVSGFLAISLGRPRATEDIDMIIEYLNAIGEQGDCYRKLLGVENPAL